MPQHFAAWARGKPQRIAIIDDGTVSNETRLGAVRDVQFAIEQMDLAEDLLIVAGDNVVDFSLTRFIAYAQEKGTSCNSGGILNRKNPNCARRVCWKSNAAR